MPTTGQSTETAQATGYGCATRAAQGVIVLFLVLGSIGYTLMALGGNPSVTPFRLALGPGLACMAVMCLPGGSNGGLKSRVGFTLLVAGAGLVAVQVMLMIGRLAPETDGHLQGLLAGPREEGVKLLAVLLLARASRWGHNHPSRLLILGVAIALVFAGLENISYLSSATFRVLINRGLAIVGHVSCTGIAISGFVIAQFLRGHRRILVPLLSFSLGAGIHAFSNGFTRLLHGNLLSHVDPLPAGATNEQWFGAPHYDELWVLVAGGFAVVWVGIFALFLIRIHRLAKTREARP